MLRNSRKRKARGHRKMVTIKDVAGRAGVSISTVSNVLNESKYVSDILQKRVRSAVTELNYVKDSVASNLKRGQTNTVGIITSDMCGLFYPYVVKGIYEVLSLRGYSLIIRDSHTILDEREIEKEYESFKNLFSNKVDGIFFVSGVTKDREKAYLEKIKSEAGALKNTPLVSIERDFSEYGIDSVFYDNVGAAKNAVNHLIDLGCENIAYIGGPKYEQIPEEREWGYLEALCGHGFRGDAQKLTAYGDYTHLSGYLAMNELLERGGRIDGVYSCNDQMAVGALKALSQRKIAVPEEIKVIGTDDVFVTRLVEPSLSTIHIKKKRMGQRAAQILLNRIEWQNGDSGDGRVIAELMDAELVVRKSTDIRAEDDSILTDW
jgi:DNA-binding LacI/PurR family transcriptional regulator